MPLRGVRCVLFDLDGTLLDSATDLGHAADDMRRARGLPSLAPEQYRSSAGSGARGMLKVAFGLAPADPGYGELCDEFLLRYEQVMTQTTRPFDGVERLVQALHERGLDWGVVTNKAARFTLPLTAGLPLFASARVMVCGDTTPHLKPHPASLIEAMRQAGTAPAHCIYVGDDERDMQAGKAAGLRTVAARYGYLGAQARVDAWPADAVIDQPIELLNWLDSA
ncbi:MAG TPA: HAD-IA family hydrolase [Ottowia sp.]|nr:HAD-IA family hydrolase [Ottowia sp.]